MFFYLFILNCTDRQQWPPTRASQDPHAWILAGFGSVPLGCSLPNPTRPKWALRLQLAGPQLQSVLHWPPARQQIALHLVWRQMTIAQRENPQSAVVKRNPVLVPLSPGLPKIKFVRTKKKKIHKDKQPPSSYTYRVCDWLCDDRGGDGWRRRWKLRNFQHWSCSDAIVLRGLTI